MAQDAELRRAGRVLGRVFRDYAAQQGWKDGDYRVFAKLNPEWGYANIILAARDFGPKDQASAWDEVKSFLDGHLGEILKEYPFVNVSLRTFDQLESGGVYGLTDEYAELDEALAPGPAA